MTEDKKQILIHQLLGLRHTVDAVLSLLMEDMGPKECAHPTKARENLTTMGGSESFRCLVCGEVVEQGV